LVFLWDIAYPMPKSKPNPTINAALFNLRDKPSLVIQSLAKIGKTQPALVISDDDAFLALTKTKQRLSFAKAGFDHAPLETEHVVMRIEAALGPATKVIILDMRWAIANMEGAASIERWGVIAAQFATRRIVISVYDLDVTIEEQLQAALRVHGQFLSPAGLHANPHWIPSDVLQSATRDEQLMFLLVRAVPFYEGLLEHRKSGEMLARGATPSWLATASTLPVVQNTNARWHIHCFGRLRVLIDGRLVDWRIAGSTPKKTRTLFAYLLQAGEKGVHADQISELLWPDEESAEVKRTRLHHTIAMLRKTLGSTESVVRFGDFYRLNAPRGSWIDIETFEQLCRRGLASLKRGDFEAARQLYIAADQLYAGDLFEDLPRDYTQSEQEDWCMPRRVWLREMALHLQSDLTKALVRLGRTREALEHCLKALAIDPADDGANAEAMRIFAVQGRREAVQRQYRQYKQAVAAVGAIESAEIKALARELA
jgi:DNA-binding SARP family transcriptional activator